MFSGQAKPGAGGTFIFFSSKLIGNVGTGVFSEARCSAFSCFTGEKRNEAEREKTVSRGASYLRWLRINLAVEDSCRCASDCTSSAFHT